MKALKPIAFYLPQFHPIPENDLWWGKGFTEWTNVVKAKPRFDGHYQPHLPSDTGFYDLRLEEARTFQAELAAANGIHGFCYYHYWFSGKQLLERPFNEVLTSGKPDFPFCLCWANENWTRRWDGQDNEILQEQAYELEAERDHIRFLCKAFSDSRYIRVNGKPLFLVYRAAVIPNLQQIIEIWRTEAYRLGIGDLFLATVESFSNEAGDPKKIGFDAAVEFQPDWANLPAQIKPGQKINWTRLGDRLFRRINKSGSDRIFSYQDLVEKMIKKESKNYLRFPCVSPGWDNSARRQTGATIFHGSTPELYGKWLRAVIEETLQQPENEGLFFINAWNEWAEGNHLEPCQRWGRTYLEITKETLEKEWRKV